MTRTGFLTSFSEEEQLALSMWPVFREEKGWVLLTFPLTFP